MSTLDELHTRALRHYLTGEHGQAEQVCATILQREPLNADAIHLLGVVALETGTPCAVALLHHATLLRPANAAFHHALGEAYRTRGDRPEAMKCFREALRCDPALAAAHHGLGQTLLDQGDLDEALTSLRQTLALQPNQPRAHVNLGRALNLRGDLAGAAACFTESVRLKPDYAIAHNNLGAVLEQGRGMAVPQCVELHSGKLRCFQERAENLPNEVALAAPHNGSARSQPTGQANARRLT